MIINANVQGSVSPQPVWIRYVEGGMATVRFTQNVTTSQDANGNTVYGYEEIEVQVPNLPNLESYLTSNASFYWDQALAEAKVQQIVSLEISLNNAYSTGFSSSAINNTALTFPFDSTSQNIWAWLQGVVADSTSSTFPANVQVKDVNNNVYTVTYTQAQQLVSDARAFFLEWSSHYHTLLGAVTTATTVPAVQVVTW